MGPGLRLVKQSIIISLWTKAKDSLALLPLTSIFLWEGNQSRSPPLKAVQCLPISPGINPSPPHCPKRLRNLAPVKLFDFISYTSPACYFTCSYWPPYWSSNTASTFLPLELGNYFARNALPLEIYKAFSLTLFRTFLKVCIYTHTFSSHKNISCE